MQLQQMSEPAAGFPVPSDKDNMHRHYCIHSTFVTKPAKRFAFFTQVSRQFLLRKNQKAG
jgi:hypothetical protein